MSALKAKHHLLIHIISWKKMSKYFKLRMHTAPWSRQTVPCWWVWPTWALPSLVWFSRTSLAAASSSLPHSLGWLSHILALASTSTTSPEWGRMMTLVTRQCQGRAMWLSVGQRRELLSVSLGGFLFHLFSVSQCVQSFYQTTISNYM